MNIDQSILDYEQVTFSHKVLEPQVKTHCQLWFNGTREPVISKVLEYKYIWYRKWGNYKPGIFQPYMLACQLPKTHWDKVPLSVSIVENVCDTATNNLRVIYNKLPEGQKAKKEFAVCVKGLDFPTDDLSVRLIEWIELLHVLGADKIFLYNLEIHPNVTKVLNYYQDKGYVDLTPISLPGIVIFSILQTKFHTSIQISKLCCIYFHFNY